VTVLKIFKIGKKVLEYFDHSPI